MIFDTDNKIVKLCAEGMEQEGKGNKAEAAQLCMQAWKEAKTDQEKFIAAHYVARHQKNIADKLKWDKTALAHALKAADATTKASLSSLYLNIGKCYEDLNKASEASENYQLALLHANDLPNDGYGKMTKAGIEAGIERVSSFYK